MTLPEKFNGSRFTHPLMGYFADDGHTFVLTEDFTYTDADGQKHTTPAWSRIDGGTIPRFFWRVIGGPFMFAVEAYAIHDGYCKRSEKMAWREMKKYRAVGDRVFLDILDYLATYRDNLPPWKRTAMFRGVRLGSMNAVRKKRQQERE